MQIVESRIVRKRPNKNLHHLTCPPMNLSKDTSGTVRNSKKRAQTNVVYLTEIKRKEGKM